MLVKHRRGHGMDKRCKNYGSGFCADFDDCNECPSKDFGEEQAREEIRPGKVARAYSVNQPKLDKACQEMADLLVAFASPSKLKQIRKQLDKKLMEVNNG